MREEDISKMDFNELRNEVQNLRDDLALLKRKYNDTIYNLDSENFGKSFTVEQDNMRAQMKMTAEAIKLKVSADDLQAERKAILGITAGSISAAVKEVQDDVASKYATLEVTADKITQTVTAAYINDKIGDLYVTNANFSTLFETSAKGVYAKIEADYEKKEDAKKLSDNVTSLTTNVHNLLNDVDELYDGLTEIEIDAGKISTKVTNLETLNSSMFKQTADKFVLDSSKVVFTGFVHLTDKSGNVLYSLGDDSSQGFTQVLLHSTGSNNLPLILGDVDSNVYIASFATENAVATRGWVEKSAKVVAVFG